MPIISWPEVMLVGPSIVLIIGYHVYLYLRVKKHPLSTAIGITNHARRLWTAEMRENKQAIVAVQTIRNQVMAATFLASTAILISLGLFSSAFRPGTFLEVSHALNALGTKSEEVWMFKLMLLGILFFGAFFNFTLAIRYYNHASFMINTYDPDKPTCCAAAVSRILNRGALHYTFGMRGFYLSIPLSLWMFGPIWMLTGSVVLIIILSSLDREP